MNVISMKVIHDWHFDRIGDDMNEKNLIFTPLTNAIGASSCR